ncbi:hypothetical protein E2C01_046342 [Portunus trituberculatus]|uniref:Uncharacterized protein n=1 Tax=Portunus trituberculatus TaxID=210409 RepID=A0A5B7G0P7_PORTR|nr:hypothetical protein [Portunus trituberculatus]
MRPSSEEVKNTRTQRITLLAFFSRRVFLLSSIPLFPPRLNTHPAHFVLFPTLCTRGSSFPMLGFPPMLLPLPRLMATDVLFHPAPSLDTHTPPLGLPSLHEASNESVDTCLVLKQPPDQPAQP